MFLLASARYPMSLDMPKKLHDISTDMSNISDRKIQLVPAVPEECEVVQTIVCG
jgi:hypothetical protein